MSIRAHRVVEIKTSGVSFNLSNDDEVREWLSNNTTFFQSLNQDCCGLTEVNVDSLREMLLEIGEKLDEGDVETLKENIEFAVSEGNMYVQYYCY